MTNLWLFVVTVAAYFSVSFFIVRPQNTNELLRRFFTIALLCMPFNILNNTVFTVFGNAVGENVMSVASVYQRAENMAFSVFGSAYQVSDKESAYVLLGLSAYQKAEKSARILLGGVVYQKAKYSETMFGASIYQTGEYAATCIGINICQNVKYGALTVFGISVIQRIPSRTKAMAVLSQVGKSPTTLDFFSIWGD